MALPLVGLAWSAALTALFSLLARVLPYLIGRTLIFLGIGFASITGIEAGYDYLIGLLQGQLNNLPFAVASILKIAGFHIAMSFIFSALAFKLSLKVVNGTMHFFSKRKSVMWA